MNSPALPSSSGLLTSFGGLKKEESLSKSVQLTRNALGIAIKKNNVDNTLLCLTQSSKKEAPDQIIKVTDTKDGGNIQIDSTVDCGQYSKDESLNKNADVSNKALIRENGVQSSAMSLVGDYGSSSESSD